MATGLKTELQKIIGVCDECKYTAEELMSDYPMGTGVSAVESTAMIAHGAKVTYLKIFPHRRSCSHHSDQKVNHGD